MKIVLVSLLERKSICLVLFAVLACDSLKEDFIEPENQVTFSKTDFYVLPTSSTVIDLKSIIKQSSISTSMAISAMPTKGTLTQMNSSIFKYTPSTDVSFGTDQFVVSYFAGGAAMRSETMTIHIKNSDNEFPCGIYLVEDRVRLDPTSTFVIHVSKNDRMCDVKNPMKVFIQLAPKFGEAVVVGDSIIYTANPSFSFRDEFVYGVSTTDGEDVELGLVSLDDRKFEVLDVPSGASKIFFVDDMTGFIAGEDRILKTIDGGMHWAPLEIQAGEADLLRIQEIFFLDKNKGFAVVAACDWCGSTCYGRLLTTTDGGQSWKLFNIPSNINSLFFTSQSIGFMSISYNENRDLITDHAIYKTIDGGETWKEVFNTQNSTTGPRVFFASDLVGYAHDPTAIYKTADGGQTWEPSVNNEIIKSFAITGGEVACASFSASSDFVTMHTPSAIVRSENGSAWKQVIEFPYAILSQGFSPEGDLGLAGGISEYDADKYFMTISKSTDKGNTWLELVKHLDGYPLQIFVPSANVAYILCKDKLIKYSPE